MFIRNLVYAAHGIPTGLVCLVIVSPHAASSTASGLIPVEPLDNDSASHTPSTAIIPHTTFPTRRDELESTPRDSTSPRFSHLRLHTATTCLPFSNAIATLSLLYNHLSTLLSANSTTLEPLLRIGFHFGAFSLFIRALSPILTVDVARALGAVLASLVSCAACVVFCAFTMVVFLVGYGVGWVVELMWRGRREGDGIVGR